MRAHSDEGAAGALRLGALPDQLFTSAVQDSPALSVAHTSAKASVGMSG
jgi:hypothetical protein